MTGTTPWKKAKAVVQVTTTAPFNWLNLPNILQGASGSAIGAYISGAEQYSYKTVQILKAGALAGSNKGVAATGVPYGETKTWGGAADLWGNTLTRDDVLASDFGLAWELGRSSDGSSRSYRVQATGYDFSLPSDAVIVGVELRITWTTFPGGGGTTGASIDAFEVRLTYTFNPRAVTSGDSVSKAYVRGGEIPEQDKKFRALIYDSDRNYIGDITKYVVNEFSFKSAINTLHSNMPLTLAQNEQSTDTAVDTWGNETPEEIGTESGEAILFDLAAAIGLGPGSNVDVNNEVDIKAYYGTYHEWVDESGEAIITDDGELIIFEEGYPLGKSIFTGYMSQWELMFGDGENVAANLLTHSKELDNIMLETDDTVAFTHGNDVGTSSIGIAGGGPTDLIRLAQVFRYTGATGARGRMRLKGWPGWASDIPVTLSVYNGTNPSSPGALVTTMSGFIKADPDNFRASTYVDFYFDPATFTNGSDYLFYIDTSYSKTGGNPTYPANFYLANNDVANGQLYYIGSPGGDMPAWTAYTAGDLWFEIYTLGGATTRTFNSQDPSAILKQILDFAALRGARVTYDNTTIEPTNTLVSITFKTNTISEAIAALLKTAPADWYYYYDYGTNQLHWHPRPTVPAHYYTKGRDTVKLKIKRTIEKLVNDVYFTGGGSPTPLFIRKTDQTFINNYRRGLAKEGDSRVTVQSTAEILAQGMIDQYGEPLYSGSLMVARVEDFRVEDVTVGELSGLISFGALVDALKMQNVSVTYHPDHLEIDLDLLTPPIPKRIEDIKRNLDELEHANDPTSPTVT